MRITKAKIYLTRFSMILLVTLALSACGDKGPVLSVSKLAAQSNFGAEKPPLPPLEVRAPQFKQAFANVAEQVIPTVVSIRRETSWAWAGFSIAFNLVAAYLVSLCIRHVGLALGF